MNLIAMDGSSIPAHWSDTWKSVLAVVQMESRTTGVMLRNGTVGDPEGDRITVVVPTASMGRQLSDDRNLRIINRALRLVTQSDWNVQFITPDLLSPGQF